MLLGAKNEKENSTRKELSIKECQAKKQCSSERYLMSGVPTETPVKTSAHSGYCMYHMLQHSVTLTLTLTN
jgi:hypothetical protein